MTNVYTLKDINNKGHRLGSASKAEINDLCEKLLAKNSEYSEREEDIGNKISQLNASSTKVRSQLISERKSHSESQRGLEAKYTAEIQSLKSEIKTLKRKATLAQKASSADKVQILSLETKIRELEECMEKGIEATHEITSREIDSRSSERLKLMEENRSLKDQLALKKNTSSQIISSEGIPLESGGAEAVPLSQEISLAPAISVIASSLILPMITYSMLALLLIVAGYLLSQYLIDYRISTGASGTSLNLLWMWANTFFDKSSGGFINIFLAWASVHANNHPIWIWLPPLPL
ncbi:hypothetical protein RhiirB3_452174 [Rhizophagus irregularis]|nr:hypothetical protein RhiirB3_452174 [Rhizophagus irregularis]